MPYTTFEQFVARYGEVRVKHLTSNFAPAADPFDSPKRRERIEGALQEGNVTITAYADVPDPAPGIVKRWEQQLALFYSAQSSGSSTVFTEIDKAAYDEVMKALVKAKDGDFPWETDADQGIPTGPGPDSAPIAAFVRICSDSPYALRRNRCC